MKRIILSILVAAVVMACSKKDATPAATHQRIDDYATFISATNKTITGANTAQVQLNIQLSSVNQIHDAHIYAYQNIYQLPIQVAEPQQYVIDDFIQPSTTSRQYYFLVNLKGGETITGNPFTVNF